ncbi:ABC transporter ATP-binding protein [bacterium]|nr:ABC transporter ATP-binding protein [bacterium]MBU1920197.1 ABC transporter ATP-binding protein [bacterium]
MIQIQNLQKNFGLKAVLRGVDLEIPTGQAVTIIGQSGSGKSVLLKHLVGLLEPDAGRVIIDGVDITNATRKDLYNSRMKIGVLFQGAALFDSMTVEENISLGLREHTLQKDGEISERVRQCLEMVSLPGIEKLKPAELSGGMKKRVGLARAIALKPEYILYDEPTTGLDPITADSINDLIIHLNEKLNVTTIVVTHDMVSAFKVSDRIVMIHDGIIIHSGTVEETQNSPRDIVRRFVAGEADDTKQVITHY